MTLTQEERKAYNKQYYSENKKIILSKILAKVECPFCESQIARNYIDTHKVSSICKRRQERLVIEKQRMQQLENKLYNNIVF